MRQAEGGELADLGLRVLGALSVAGLVQVVGFRATLTLNPFRAWHLQAQAPGNSPPSKALHANPRRSRCYYDFRTMPLTYEGS